MSSNQLSQIAAALQAGQLSQAEQQSRAALLEQPRDESLLLLLAISLQYQGRMLEARDIHAELTRLYPASSTHWNNYATIHAALGEQNEARAAYAKAAELDPHNIDVLLQLGLLLIEQHEYLAARHTLLDAYALDQASPQIRVAAARACCLCQDFENAEELLKPWHQWLPLNDDGLQFELARVLVLQTDVTDAAALLEDVLSRNPSQLDARLLLATIYERFNRLELCEAMVQPVLAAASGATASQRNEASHVLATLAMRRNDVTSALRLLEQAGPKDNDDNAHFFQLASVYDKLGERDAAMQALSEAHRLSTRQRQHDSPEFFGPDARALATDAPRVSAEQYARWPHLIAPEMQDSPIFVVGFPRSGTTLLEQMLDAHPGLQSMDENPYFNRLANILRKHDTRILDDLGVLQQYDCDELRKRYHAMVSERITRRWDARLVDKNPLNMQWLPVIHRLFPEAKFILALRHPCDVLLSCYMQNFRSSALMAACSSLERLAHAYVETMSNWLEDVNIFQPSVMVSRYEDLVSDFRGQTRRIAEFLALEDDTPMLSFDQHARGKAYIGTPSYSQVIEPVNRKGLNRWHNYRRHFEPVLPILEPMLKHWDYPID